YDRPARRLPEVEALGQPGEAPRGDVQPQETVARRLADRNRRVVLVHAEPDLELAEPVAADAIRVARIAIDALHAGWPRVRDGRDAVELRVAVRPVSRAPRHPGASRRHLREGDERRHRQRKPYNMRSGRLHRPPDGRAVGRPGLTGMALRR